MLPNMCPVNITWIWMMAVLVVASPWAAIAEETPTITIDPHCLAECGNISIPYPFGTGPGCFLPGFEVTCSNTFSPPRLFLGGSVDPRDAQQIFTGGTYSTDDINHTSNFSDRWDMIPMEVMDILVSQAQVRLYAAMSSDCISRQPYHSFTRVATLVPYKGPFLISASNALIGIGLNAEVELSTSISGSFGGFLTQCTSQTNGIAAKDGPCKAQGCCEAGFPKSDIFHQLEVVADKKRTDWMNSRAANITCSFGMLVEKGWYNYSLEDVYGDAYYFSKKFPKGVPQVLDFAIGNSTCPAQGQPTPQGYACLSGNSSCIDASNTTGYVCKCWEHYDGNPYIPGAGGCQDIDECQLREQYSEMRTRYPCSSGGVCKNRLLGYDCPCKPGMKGDGKTGVCTEKFPQPAKVAVGVVGGISIIVVLVLFVLLLNERKRMRDFFIRNGGPMLEKINNIKIFKQDELKRITKNYSHILGSGAFGVVYMGFLDDKQRIAVKKSKNTNKAQIDQFTNEVIIQSRVIHKNIVKLVGCCLEVDVPILVYEFVPNGSLEDILHNKNRVPLTIDQRLAIAAESAEGLAYMHSKTSTNIQHGDVKPANILLDDDFMPKISDFGISRLIARGNDQHSEEVIGDNNYMDPVYRETGLLTNKSDVYSFGLVLYELITGNKAIGGDNCGYTIYHLGTYTKENRANVTSGIQLGEDENFELLQSQLREGKDFEILQSLAEIARECLHCNVDQRPEMTDIAERLHNIRKRYACKLPSP